VITPRSEILQEIERRRLDLNIGLLKVYNYYRVLVGLALLVVSSQRLIESRLGDLDQAWFIGVTGVYTLINLLAAVTVQLLPVRSFAREYPALALVLFDILALTWLTYLSGGVGSGLGALILVSIATGSIIVTGAKANVLPAVATLAILLRVLSCAVEYPAARRLFSGRHSRRSLLCRRSVGAADLHAGQAQ